MISAIEYFSNEMLQKTFIPNVLYTFLMNKLLYGNHSYWNDMPFLMSRAV